MLAPAADFDRQEYQNRYARIRQLMEKNKMDALLVSSENNYIYLTGHRSDQNSVDKARPYMVLIPLEGEPVVFTMGFERGHLNSATYIENFRTYSFFEHVGVIEKTLKELKLDKARIGWEIGREQYLGMAVNDFLSLQQLLPDAEFVDGSPVLLQARAVKSPAEIAYIREACSTTSVGLDNALSQVKIGMSERDIYKIVARELVEASGEWPTDMRVVTGKDHSGDNFNMFATPRIVEAGDTVTIDSGVRIAGYASDIARTVVVGEASQQQIDMYNFVMELNAFSYSFLKPGLPCSEAARQVNEELQRQGYTRLAVGRIGHGVGLDCLEYPSLRDGEEIPIEEGMVFACNPNFPLEFGYFNIEENLVVNADGAEVLANPSAPKELKVVGV